MMPRIYKPIGPTSNKATGPTSTKAPAPAPETKKPEGTAKKDDGSSK